MTEGQTISRQEFERVKPKPMDVLKFFGVSDNPAFTGKEKAYIRAISRGLKLQTRPSYVSSLDRQSYIKEGDDLIEIGDPESAKLALDIARPEKGGFRSTRRVIEIAEVLAGTADKPENLTGVMGDGVKHLIKGNFFKEMLAGKGNCLDTMLGTILLTKKYGATDQKSDFTARLIPYNYSLAQTGSTYFLGHDHYAMTFQNGGESFLMVYPNGVVPLMVIEDSRGTQARKEAVASYLKENYDIDDEKDMTGALERIMNNDMPHKPRTQLDTATGHVLAAYRAMRNLPEESAE